MKRDEEDQNRNDTRTSRHIFRKKRLDETVFMDKQDIEEEKAVKEEIPDPDDFDIFEDSDENLDEDADPDLDFDNVTFGFTDEDIERFKRRNLEEAERKEKSRRPKTSDASFYRENEDGTVDKDPMPDASYRNNSAGSSVKKPFFHRNKTKVNRETPDGETSYDLNLKRQTNKEIMRVTYIVIAVFAGMVAYFVHFDTVTAETVVNNIHNSRLDKLDSEIVRGTIYSSDGEVLAQTTVNDDGTMTREYPFGCTFAHVIGTSDVNKSGVELSCDYQLVTADTQPLQKIINDITGEKSVGCSVTTTLDADLQQVAHDALGEEQGAVIALDPETGAVLAMVSKPDYDPNTLKEEYESIVDEEGNKQLLNQATQGTFTPGSIFKIVTSLCYIRNGQDIDDYEYYCDGDISLASDDDYSTLKCYDGEVHGYVDLTESFAESCNTSYANIGISLPEGALKETAEDLLFNSKLPTDFTTAKSSFSLSENDTEWTVGATSIGQGSTTISPIHIAMITSAIANGGELMEPYVVQKIVDSDGNTVSNTKKKTAATLMSSSEASRLTEMMKAVVEEGTGYKLADRSYTVAGKTGTAEVTGSGNNAWFVGFAPAEDPQIVLVVLVEDAETSSSSTAVPIAGEILDAWFGEE